MKIASLGDNHGYETTDLPGLMYLQKKCTGGGV